MSLTRWLIFGLFFPASLILVGQILRGNELAHQSLALAFLLFSIEQARMAALDLEQIAEVNQQIQDDRLDQFYRVTVSTIGLELLGFYIASVWLGWGGLLVLLSQVWFNLLANVRLHPGDKILIHSWDMAERLLILSADGIGIVLVSLWILQIAPLGMALGLLGLMMIFGWIKYILPVFRSWRSLS
ncbi:MAG TPA: hypothetical protein V6C57_19330 [Coleofasciculaceae cyanobacterium]